MTASFTGRRPGARPIPFGRAVQITGRLRTASGRPLARAGIQVRDESDHVLARTRTDARGNFRVSVVPRRSGRLRIGVPRTRRLVEPSSGPSLAVRVRPRIVLRVSSTRVSAGGRPVVFAGRILPAPRLLAGPPRKAIVLEWIDPIRRTWRPVVNAMVGGDGRFRLSWRFGAGARGFAVPMRVTIPPEIGWPLAPAASRHATIRVR